MQILSTLHNQTVWYLRGTSVALRMTILRCRWRTEAISCTDRKHLREVFESFKGYGYSVVTL